MDNHISNALVVGQDLEIFLDKIREWIDNLINNAIRKIAFKIEKDKVEEKVLDKVEDKEKVTNYTCIIS